MAAPQFRFTSEAESSTAGTVTQFVVVGNTVASLIVAQKILQRYPSAKVYHLFEGKCHYDNTNIVLPLYGSIACNSPEYRQQNVVDYVNNTTTEFVSDSEQFGATVITRGDRALKALYTPFGLGAEAIAAYPSVVQLSPFIDGSNNFQQTAQVESVTSKERLSGVELTNATTIASRLGIGMTDSVINDRPGMYSVHYRFISSQAPDGARVTGINLFSQLRALGTARYESISNISTIRFIDGVISGNPLDRVYFIASVEFSTEDGGYYTIGPSVIYLRGNLFDNLRIAQNGGVPSLNAVCNAYPVPSDQIFNNGSLVTLIPSFYRAVYSIPINSTVIGSTTFGPENSNYGQQLSFTYGDGVGSSPTLGWLVQVYTTGTDLRTQMSAVPGKCILVVEGVCVANTRNIMWSRSQSRFLIYLNEAVVEESFFNRFKEITNQIRSVYEAASSSSLVSLTAVPDVETLTSPSGMTTLFDHFSQGQEFLTNDFNLLNECYCMYPRVLNNNLS